MESALPFLRNGEKFYFIILQLIVHFCVLHTTQVWGFIFTAPKHNTINMIMKRAMLRMNSGSAIEYGIV